MTIVKLYKNWTDEQIRKDIQALFALIEGYGDNRHMVQVGHETIRKARTVLRQRAQGIYWEQM